MYVTRCDLESLFTNVEPGRVSNKRYICWDIFCIYVWGELQLASWNTELANIELTIWNIKHWNTELAIELCLTIWNMNIELAINR